MVRNIVAQLMNAWHSGESVSFLSGAGAATKEITGYIDIHSVVSGAGWLVFNVYDSEDKKYAVRWPMKTKLAQDVCLGIDAQF